MNYLIDFVETASVLEIEEYLRAIKANTIKIFDNFDKVYLVMCEIEPVEDVIVSSINIDDSHNFQLLGDLLPINPYYRIIDPTKSTISVSTTDNKDWWKNYILKTIDFNLPESTVSRKGSMANVYIMDSGIDTTHPEFVNSNITNLYTITTDFSDTNGHGTAIASLIAGETCGLSSAKLKIVKIFDDTVGTKQSDFLSGLDAILTDYLISPNQLGIVNCSWSIPHNEYIESKINMLIAAGLNIIVSAGNSGLPITDVTPAAMPNVLTIGSFNKDLKPSDFSNYTSTSVITLTQKPTNTGQLDGWAPGEDIWVAMPGGSYGYASGTSMAAAIQSCVLAYDFDGMFTEDGQLIPNATNQPIDNLANLSLSKRGLLDLSDPRYSTSRNAISTLFNNVPLSLPVRPFLLMRSRVNSSYSVMLYNTQTTKSAEVITDLPDFCTVFSNGVITMMPKSVIGEYQIFKSIIRVTDNQDVVTDQELSIVVLSENFDRATQPDNDPILALTLESVSCYAQGGAYTGSCDDDCQAHQFNACTYYMIGKNSVCNCGDNGAG